MQWLDQRVSYLSLGVHFNSLCLHWLRLRRRFGSDRDTFPEVQVSGSLATSEHHFMSLSLSLLLLSLSLLSLLSLLLV